MQLADSLKQQISKKQMSIISSAEYIYEKVVDGLRCCAQKFIFKRRSNF